VKILLFYSPPFDESEKQVWVGDVWELSGGLTKISQTSASEGVADITLSLLANAHSHWEAVGELFLPIPSFLLKYSHLLHCQSSGRHND
jgi:hypothetical protein